MLEIKSKLTFSNTKFDIVRLVEIVANGDIVKANLSQLNPSIVKKILVTDDATAIPVVWKRIINFPEARGQFTLLAVAICHHDFIDMFVNEGNVKDGIGKFKFESNNKVVTNLRSALVGSGSAEMINRRSQIVPFDFVDVLNSVESGPLFKEYIVSKIEFLFKDIQVSEKIFNEALRDLEIAKILGITENKLKSWLNGNKLGLKNRPKDSPLKKSADRPLIPNKFICDPPEPINLIDAIRNVVNGKWALAPFQRPERWEWKQQELLLDSLIQGIPIGVMYLWEYDPKSNLPFRNFPGVMANQSKLEALILDGQQRLSFLSWLYISSKTETFDYGPGMIYYNGLENEFTRTESHEDLEIGVIKVHNVFQNGFRDKMSKALTRSVKRSRITFEEHIYITENMDGLFNALTDRPIVIQKLKKTEGIPESFKLYERVNKAGTHLKGDDYVEAALFSVYPNLYNDIKNAVKELIQDPDKTKKPTFKNIFNRSYFIRSILDELYGTPNPGEREVLPLSRIMQFGNPTYENGKGKVVTLKEKNVHDAFKSVYSAFQHYREILVEDLFIHDDSGLSGPFSIPVNTVLRTQSRRISKIRKGKFIRWFILFHIQHNAYLGSQDKKIKEDCEAGKLTDPFNKLDELLAAHAGKELNQLKFTTRIYGDFKRRTPNQVKFLYHVNLAIAIHLGARDWFEDKKLEKVKRSDLHKHHIFPKSLFDPSEKKYYDHIANIARIIKRTNSSINNNEPNHKRYLPDIYKRDKSLLLTQQIPANNQKYWRLFPKQRNKPFVLKRVELLVEASNDFLKKLDTGKWEENHESAIISTDIELLNQIESQTLEFKETLLFDIVNNRFDIGMVYIIVKEVAGFMNNGGGTLFIGVKDKVNVGNRVMGLQRDLDCIADKYDNYSDPKEGFQTILNNRLKADLKKKNFDLIDFNDFVLINGKILYKIVVPHVGDVAISKFKKWSPIKDKIKVQKNVIFVRRQDQTNTDRYIDENGKKVTFD